MPINKFVIIGLMAIILIEGAYLITTKNPNINAQTIYIEYKNGNFIPDKITIGQGSRVIFFSESEKFWPASDPHPEHHYLSEFDPQKEIQPGAEWSYIAAKPGTWRYHDHLSPSAMAEIEVLSKTKSKKEQGIASDCSQLSSNEESQCWYEKIKLTTKEKGIEPAFQMFTDAYSGGAALGCHWTAHLIGYETYKQYIAGNKFKITKATSYCGYGFYHGFMEPLLRELNDPKFALEFCEEVGKQLGNDGRNNCYHGIGHGFTEDPPPQNTWGKHELMGKPAIKVCEKMFGDNKMNLNTCSSGVFTVIAHFAADSKYGLSLDYNDPFKICKESPIRYEIACYGEFAPKLAKITNWTPTKVPPLVEHIKDPYTKEIAIRGALGAMMQEEINNDLSKFIKSCNHFGDFKNICLKGLVWGIIDHGLPEYEYKRLFEFCKIKDMDKEQRGMCFKMASERLNEIYSKSKIIEAQKEAPQEYKHFFAKK